MTTQISQSLWGAFANADIALLVDRQRFLATLCVD
jgi:hypothetical protein